MSGSLASPRGLRCMAGAAAVVVVCGMAPYAVASPGHNRVWNLRYSYAGRAPGMLVVTGHIRSAPHALFALVTVDPSDPAAPSAPSAQIVDVGDHWPRTYGAAGNHPLCTGPVRCVMQHGMLRFSVTIDMSGRGSPSRLWVYLIARGRDAVVHNNMLSRWRVSLRHDHLLDSYDTQTVGAGVDAGADAGATIESALTAPFSRSVAVAVPGCEVVGAGAARLQGGATTPIAVCPQGPVAAYSPRPTTWRMVGLTAGVSYNRTRLLVFAG